MEKNIKNQNQTNKKEFIFISHYLVVRLIKKLLLTF